MNIQGKVNTLLGMGAAMKKMDAIANKGENGVETGNIDFSNYSKMQEYQKSQMALEDEYNKKIMNQEKTLKMRMASPSFNKEKYDENMKELVKQRDLARSSRLGVESRMSKMQRDVANVPKEKEDK